MSLLFSPPSPEDLTRLLKAWRFWVLAALIGGILGAALYLITPPAYRARASAQVDFNIEEAYTPTQDKQAFYYLEREVRKLQDVAFSDAVLQAVADEVGGVSIAELRDEKLLLSQPGEAGWHFFAEDRDPQRAEALASAWTNAFIAEVRDAATASMTLQSFHAEIETGCDGDCSSIEAQVAALEARARGISPYVEAGPLQTQQLPVTRKLDISAYILIGALSFVAIAALFVLFVPGRRVER
ncbi:MAG: hypothetical protein HFACDABA_01465 [Anaerolineales bacterium]|nr:hypothetical protein [Anaerolineales bacterium]